MPEDWKPACDLAALQLRAKMLAKIRLFFEQRSVLEVETPLLCSAIGTDPQLDFFSSLYHCEPNNKEMYLQTSPEFAMKRLLASGSGSIFQICKAFRNGELGRLHNPEFTILEWYRIDFSLDQLMSEVIELLVQLFGNTLGKPYIINYSTVFEQTTGLNPLVFCLQTYSEYVQDCNLEDAIQICGDDHSMWLDFIFSYKVQAALEKQPLCLVYGYPAIQSSLARINKKNPLLADRFEVFLCGVEVGNGFFELSDAVEQEQRFDDENKIRQQKGLCYVNKDRYFLSALDAGLPDCSGIAIGLDRLLMMLGERSSLDNVISFPYSRA